MAAKRLPQIGAGLRRGIRFYHRRKALETLLASRAFGRSDSRHSGNARPHPKAGSTCAPPTAVMGGASRACSDAAPACGPSVRCVVCPPPTRPRFPSGAVRRSSPGCRRSLAGPAFGPESQICVPMLSEEQLQRAGLRAGVPGRLSAQSMQASANCPMVRSLLAGTAMLMPALDKMVVGAPAFSRPFNEPRK